MNVTSWSCVKCHRQLGVILLGNLLVVIGSAASVKPARLGQWTVTCCKCGGEKTFVGAHVLFSAEGTALKL